MFCSASNRWLTGTCAVLTALLGSLSLSSTGLANETVQVCGSTYTNNVFGVSTVPAITATGRCPTIAYNGAGFALSSNNMTATRGQAGRWEADAPAGLELVGATASQILSAGVNDVGGDYGGGFYWAGGGAQTNDQTDQNPSLGMVVTSPSKYFGMQLICGKGTCTQPAQLSVGSFSLYVQETVGPTFAAPTGLWQTSGWVRGTWPFFAWGDSPSGLCSLSASLNGLPIGQTTSAQDVSTWHQCAAAAISEPVDTTRYGQGDLPLTLTAEDAAGVPASTTKNLFVDNQQPTVALSGPSDAPSTAGTQYVTATATAGPSGIAGISCSVDGAPAQWYPSNSAQVPVSGVGQHEIQCLSENTAVDPTGGHGESSPESFSMKIGIPTITGIAFSRIVDGLRCHLARERVKVPARWVTVRKRRKPVQVRRRAHTKLVKVVKCHPRTVGRRRSFVVVVRRDGKKVRVKRRKVVRVILQPHLVNASRRFVAHGRATTVSGWLGTYTGVALGGQSVQVLAAPNNGQEALVPAATATTASDGGWSATLPAGPSRLIAAAYGGGAGVEPSLSGAVQEVVPAQVKLLSVSPRRVAWGGSWELWAYVPSARDAQCCWIGPRVEGPIIS